MLFHRLLMALAIAVLAFSGASPALANGKDISFEADTVSVNDEDGSMLAVGNVQMKQARMTLTADEVRYNRDDDRAVANGNVVFVDADGAIHKSDMMVLDTEFTHIIAETLRSRYPDGSFFTASSGDI
ncbi:MAG: LptA/OstA family protein, partial [Alphaproteobacteria bacterium]